MNTTLFRYLFILIFCIMSVQTTEAQWINIGNTRSVALGEAVARDVSGNVYGTGIFTCDLVFQNDTLHNPSCGSATTLPLPVLRFDGYIVKYTATGQFLWAKQIIGNTANALFEVKGISVSSSSIFITGHYKGSLTFGSTTITNTTSVSDAFIACYDQNGNFNWVKNNFTRNTAASITAASISAGTDGSAVFTGKYKDSIISPNNLDTAYSDNNTAYLMKFDASGNYLWTVSSKGKNTGSRAEGTDLWQDTNGNIFLTGNATDTVFVQQDTINFKTGTSGIFISKFNSSGKLLWLKKEKVAHVNTLELEKDQKHILLGGDYKNNNTIVGADTLKTGANYGAYIARYDTSGAMQWVKTLTVAAADSAAVVYGVSGDINGNVYATGIFGRKSSSSAVLTSSPKSITAKPGVTFFTAKYKSDGTVQWLESYADGPTDKGSGIVAYDSSQVFITGYFAKSIRVDSTLVTNSSVGLNSFVARIDDCPFIKAIIRTPLKTVACRKDSILLQAVTAPGLLYQWQKNGVNISGATTANLYAKDSASYRLIVRSTNPSIGCIKYSPGIFITINPLPDTSIFISGKLAFCEGAQVTLNAAFGYKYKWIVNGAAPLIKDTLAGYVSSISGTYRVALLSNKGCKDSSRTFTTIAEPIPAPFITPAGKFNICIGDSMEMNTAVDATYKYQWYKNSVLLTNDTLPLYKAFATGRFKVFVKNRLGCGTFSLEDTVTAISSPTATISNSGNLTACSYQLPTLSTTANTTSNTVAWLKDGVVLPSVNGNTYVPQQNGVYHVKVTNAFNCSNESPKLTVTINPQPVATATLSGSSNFCANDSVRINAPAGAYTYVWQRNGTSIPTAQSAVYYGKQAGTYRVIISDLNLCSDTSNTVLLIPSAIPVAAIQASGNLTFCTGDSVLLNSTPGSALAYEWFLNGATAPSLTGRIQTIKTSGDYAVRVYNSIGCADTSGIVNVHVYAVPPNTINVSGLLEFCSGSQVTLSATQDAAFLYQWRKNNVTIPSGGNNADYVVTSSGNYNVVISINAKCTSTSSVYAVNVKPLVKPVITVDNEFISTAAYLSYQWYKNGTALTGATNQIYEVTNNGQYSVQVTDPSDCSVQADPVMVCVPVPHIQANGSFLTSTSGTTYQWYVNGVAISNATSQSYLVNVTGDYKIKVSRNDGCVSFSNIIRVCIPPPVITIGINNVLTASAGLNYQWFLNGTAIPDADTRIIVAEQSGAYTVQVEDLSGCISISAPVSIVVLSTMNGFTNAPVRCYPNPFEDLITIDIQTASLLPAKAAVYDTNGTLLLETTINNTEEILSTDQLAPGAYVLLITTGSNRFYYKLIKTPK